MTDGNPQALVEAVSKGDLDNVNALLNAKTDPNVSETSGWTVLMRAAYRGDVEIVKSLLAYGAHVDQETIKLAKNRRNKEIVSILENHLRSQQETAKTDKPVESFVKESEQEVEILLDDLGEQETSEEKAANSPWKCPTCGQAQSKEFDECPVCRAASWELDDVRQESTVEVPSLTEQLMEASLRGDVNVVELLDKGADVNAKDKYGWTALIKASQGGSVDIVEKLLAKAADVNAKAEDGWTALMAASVNGHINVVKLLLDKGADINAKNYIGQTALMLASYHARQEVVDLLKAHGAQVLEQTGAPESLFKTLSEFIEAEVKGLWQKYKVLIVVGGIVIIVACLLSGSLWLKILTSALGTFASIFVLTLAARMDRRRDTPKALEMPALPEEFLELDASLRKRALDLAWEPVWQRNIKEMVSGGTKRSSAAVAYVFYHAGILTGLILNFVLLVVAIAPVAVAIAPDSPASQSSVSKSPGQTKQEPSEADKRDRQIRANTKELRVRLYKARLAGKSLEGAMEEVMPSDSEKLRRQVFDNWMRLGLYPPLESEMRELSTVTRAAESNFDETNTSLTKTAEFESKTLLVLFLLGSLLGSYYVGLVCLSSVPDLERKALEEEGKERYRVILETRLRDLAIKHVGENYWSWIEYMGQETEHRAQVHAGASPNKTFRLVSPELALKESGMPYKTFYITYIFSNGYISVVSDISWDMYSTIDSLAELDEPAYIMSDEATYRSEEFHYQDVVEVTYKPGTEPEVSVGGHSSNEVKKELRLVKEHEFMEPDPSAEGKLTLSLVNGEKKEYPCVKDAATNFLTEAREKVRLAKRR